MLRKQFLLTLTRSVPVLILVPNVYGCSRARILEPAALLGQPFKAPDGRHVVTGNAFFRFFEIKDNLIKFYNAEIRTEQLFVKTYGEHIDEVVVLVNKASFLQARKEAAAAGGTPEVRENEWARQYKWVKDGIAISLIDTETPGLNQIILERAKKS
ncbi:hypothetical protein [Niabella drilacis]|uniref:Uncharacterized protein n=1 Tax=Niabella drilacis (strain DSM 25811 / CCM 8410 / CCUG 62505 / LMG 26954 / E90) TaxID=1285928 RepID=A0A1G6SP45_NIADE|nr:hypothetical protein [Niabella drilacis]SDD17895.1 hypothetical protein SAMN04487894_106281 [Niabella drilacis]